MASSSSIPILLLRVFQCWSPHLYGPSTRVLNQAVRRNPDRFPEDFRFQLISEEKSEVITKCDHLKKLKFSKALPHAFTEHGVLMASNVLNSPAAVKMSVFVIRSFVKQWETLAISQNVIRRLAEMDKKLLLHDTALSDIYKKLRPLLPPPPIKARRIIGFGPQQDEPA